MATYGFDKIQCSVSPAEFCANCRNKVTRLEKQLILEADCNCPNCQESPTGKALRHKCHIENCGKEYAKTSHLRAHLGSHSAILPFACNWPGCGKRFYRTDQLTRHERTHTGEKRFVCFVCSRAFSRSDHLNKHAKRHTPEEIANATGGNGAEPKAAP